MKIDGNADFFKIKYLIDCVRLNVIIETKTFKLLRNKLLKNDTNRKECF